MFTYKRDLQSLRGSTQQLKSGRFHRKSMAITHIEQGSWKANETTVIHWSRQIKKILRVTDVD